MSIFKCARVFMCLLRMGLREDSCISDASIKSIIWDQQPQGRVKSLWDQKSLKVCVSACICSLQPINVWLHLQSKSNAENCNLESGVAGV